MVGWVLVLSLIAGQGETPPSDELKSEVRRLVRQLDAPELARRDAAEAALLKRGPAVLGLLPASSERTPAEVRQRIVRIRQKLEQQAAESVAQPSLVTLRSNGMPLSKVLASLTTQTGNAIVDQPVSNGPAVDSILRVNFEKTAFWPALDQALDQAGLTLYPFTDRPTLQVMAGSGPKRANRSASASYSGPFRFEAIAAIARRDLRQRDGLLAVSVEAMWEPRVRMIGLMQRMADVTATAKNGNPLIIADRDAQLEIPTNGEAPAVRFDIPLRLPPRTVRRVASLKGKLQAMIAGRAETFRYDNLPAAKNAEQRIAGVTVTLERVETADKTITVRMHARFDDAGDALASHRTWIFSNPAYLEASDGKRIDYDSYDTTRQTKNAVGIAFLFKTERSVDKLTFVYKTPGTIVTRDFAYELKNIELP